MTRKKQRSNARSPAISAEVVERALRSVFAPPEHAIFFEVPAGTGAAGRRRVADAVAMSLWPSRGLEIVGVEIKTSRSDWLRERKNPEKAEEIAAYCDRWALATAEGVAKPEEIPRAWDWFVVSGEGRISPARRGVATAAKPPDRTFVAALLRSAEKTVAAAQAEARAAKSDAERKAALAVKEGLAGITAEVAGDARRRKHVADAALAAMVTDALGTGVGDLLRDKSFAPTLAAVRRLRLGDDFRGIVAALEHAARTAGTLAFDIKTIAKDLSDGGTE